MSVIRSHETPEALRASGSEVQVTWNVERSEPDETSGSENQHSVAVTIEPILLLDGLAVALLDQLLSGES